MAKKRKNPIKNVAVIGAGFSGLVSSLLLSQMGKEVVLIERDVKIAPLLRNCFYDGYEVNNAFQYLGGYYPGGALHKSFERLGLNDGLIPVAINDRGLDCFLGVIDGDLIIPVGLKKVRSVLEGAFPQNEPVLSEYFEKMEEVFLTFSFSNLKDFFSKTAAGMAGISLKDFLVSRRAGRELIEFLSIYSEMLLGVKADEVPLLTHLLGVGAYFISAHTFRGGGGALVSVLEKKVREAEIQVLTDSEVVRLECDTHRKYTGLDIRSLKSGKTITLHTDACVSTIHPRRLLSILPAGLPSDFYFRRIANYNDTNSICLFHLVLDQGSTQRYQLNTHLVDRGEDGGMEHQLAILPNYRNLEDTTKKEQRWSVLINAWENDVKEGCPGRKRDLTKNNGDSIDETCRQSKPEFLERICYNMTSKLEAVFPELKGKYRIIQTLSPCDFDRINRSWHGSIYGVKCSVDRLDFTSSGPLRRLFLAGQSVIAPGIFGTLISSCLAVERLMR